MGASAPSPWPARPLSRLQGRSSVTWLLFLSLGQAASFLRAPWGRLRQKPPLFTLSEECRLAFLRTGSRRVLRGRKHLLRIPSPADCPTLPRRRSAGCLEVPPGPPAGSGEETPRASAATPVFGGGRAGVLNLSPHVVGSWSGCRGGTCGPSLRARVSGESAGGAL